MTGVDPSWPCTNPKPYCFETDFITLGVVRFGIVSRPAHVQSSLLYNFQSNKSPHNENNFKLLRKAISKSYDRHGRNLNSEQCR